MPAFLLVAALVFASTGFVGCGDDAGGGSAMQDSTPNPETATAPELATFGAGCFWCVEAVFAELKGVISVRSGYMGGHIENPTYEQVCGKESGHAEVAQIKFDPQVIEFKDLLEVFWKTHDPTTLDRQGADAGPQYRSAIFAHSAEQRRVAEGYRAKLDTSGAFPSPIVTEIADATTFFVAEDNHQDYYARNPNGGYCAAVIGPKLEKFRKAFAAQLKD
jgi:peptide-methionine (S)-S-oxide reductase